VLRIRIVLATLLFATGTFALDSNRALTQARLSIWTPEPGLPQSTIDAIVQTRDGYLWMGTEEGLVRFDGVRFVVNDRQTAPALRSSFISSLYEAPDGTLWIGTYGGGLARLRNGKIEAFHPELLGSDRMRGMHAARDGALFIATAGGGPRLETAVMVAARPHSLHTLSGAGLRWLARLRAPLRRPGNSGTSAAGVRDGVFQRR
jgi:ligand-binding sensor domain-containing protein